MKMSFEVEQKIKNDDAEELELEYKWDGKYPPQLTLRKPGYSDPARGVRQPSETIILTDNEFDDLVERVTKFRKAREELYGKAQ